MKIWRKRRKLRRQDLHGERAADRLREVYMELERERKGQDFV